MTSLMTPDLEGAALRIVEPVNYDRSAAGPLMIVVDTIGTVEGDMVYLVKGKEACIPWRKALAPIDAAIVGLVDGMKLG